MATETIADLLSYYSQPELYPLVQELIAATADIDTAFERQEKAIKALSEGWQAVEAKRAAAYELEAAE
jgi:hypothetical protein